MESSNFKGDHQKIITPQMTTITVKTGTRLKCHTNRVESGCAFRGLAVPLFYLNVRNGDELIRDPEAYTFPTAQAARDATERTMRAMIVASPDVTLTNRQIEIADITGHAISVICIHDVAPELGFRAAPD
jgi:hypothetical protein